MPVCPYPLTPELSAFGDGWAVTPHTWCAGHHVTSPKGTCVHPNLSWGGKVNPVKSFKAAASSWVHSGTLCGQPARALRVTTVDTGAPGPRAGLGQLTPCALCSGVSLPQGWPHRLGCIKRLITEDANFSPCADKRSPCHHAGFCGETTDDVLWVWTTENRLTRQQHRAPSAVTYRHAHLYTRVQAGCVARGQFPAASRSEQEASRVPGPGWRGNVDSCVLCR